MRLQQVESHFFRSRKLRESANRVLTQDGRLGWFAAFGSAAEVACDLVEWTYGENDCSAGAEIYSERLDWRLFRHGPLDGASTPHVAVRAHRVVSGGPYCVRERGLSSSGHFIHVLASRSIKIEPLDRRSGLGQ